MLDNVEFTVHNVYALRQEKQILIILQIYVHVWAPVNKKQFFGSLFVCVHLTSI
jgi:hypothetical protein